MINYLYMFNQLLQKCLVLIFILLFLLLPIFVNAKTIVQKNNNCNYTVFVSVFFDFDNDLAEFIIKEWQDSMTIIWNSAQAKNLSAECQIHYNFDLKLIDKNKTCFDYPNTHCINIVEDKYNVNGDVATTVKIAPNSNKKGWGEWTSRTNSLQAAHEIGHLMGLGDDYYYDDNGWVNNNYQIFGPQSIMAQTWGGVTALSDHSKEIIKQAGFNLPETSHKFFLLNLAKPKLSKFYKLGDLNIYYERPKEDFIANSLIKGVTDPKVYYVDTNGQLHWVTNETVAQQLFGPEWNKKITWFSDAIIYTYSCGKNLE